MTRNEFIIPPEPPAPVKVGQQRKVAGYGMCEITTVWFCEWDGRWLFGIRTRDGSEWDGFYDNDLCDSALYD